MVNTCVAPGSYPNVSEGSERARGIVIAGASDDSFTLWPKKAAAMVRTTLVDNNHCGWFTVSCIIGAGTAHVITPTKAFRCVLIHARVIVYAIVIDTSY